MIVKGAEHLYPEKASLFKDISLTRNTVAERIEDMSLDSNQQLKDALLDLSIFLLLLMSLLILVEFARLAVLLEPVTVTSTLLKN